MSQKSEKRIHILSPNEVRELYERPVFSQADREDYFSLDPHIQKIIDGLEKLETRIYFILTSQDIPTELGGGGMRSVR